MTKNKIIIPDVSAIAREMAGSSQMMMVIKKFLKISCYSKYLLIKNNIKYLPKLTKMDYAVGVKLLCELELLEHKKILGKIFCLHFQMVDMAVAVKNKRVLSYFFDLAKTYDFIPGLATNNYYYLVEMLANINQIPTDMVIFTNCRINDSFSKLASFKIDKL
jgi:hypothetical protein